MFRLARLGLRHLGARRLRTSLSVLAVALGVGLIVGTQLTSGALDNRSRQLADELFGNTDVQVHAFSKAGLQPQMVNAIDNLPSVDTISAQLSKQTAADLGGRRSFVLLDGIDVNTEGKFHDLKLSAGKWFSPASHSEVVLAQGLADAHGLRPGAKIRLVTAAGFDTFDVAGVLAPGSLADLNFGQAVFVSLQAAEDIFRAGSRVQQVEVKFNAGATLDQFRAELSSVATQDYVIVDRQSVTGDPQRLLAGIRPLAFGLSFLSLLLALLLVGNTLALDVIEQRRSIGILRAAGATGGQVGGIFLIQAIVVGTIGAAVGIVLGYAMARVAVVAIASQTSLGQVEVPIPVGQVLLIALAGVLLCIVASVTPGRRAATMGPLEALRPNITLAARRPSRALAVLGLLLALAGFAVLVAAPLAAIGGIGGAMLFAGLALLLPTYLPTLLRLASVPVIALGRSESLLAMRGLERRRGRTAVTVGGIALTSAALLALGGLSQSAQSESGQWVNSLFVSKYLLVSPVDQPLTLANQFSSVHGVLAVSPVSSFTVRSGDVVIPVSAVEPLHYASAGHLRLLAGDTHNALIGLLGEQILLPSALADTLHKTAGDHVKINTDNGPTDFTVAGVLYHSLPTSEGGESAIMSLATAQQDFGVSTFNLLQIIPTNDSSVNVADLRQRALSFGMDLVTVGEIQAAVDRGVAGVILVLQALAVIGVVVALLGILNTMVINVAEGQRELALLRSIGMTTSQMTRLVLSEAAILALVGAALGIIAGAVALFALLKATATETFQPQFVLPVTSIGVVVGGLVIASLLAAALPARQVARASILESIRAE